MEHQRTDTQYKTVWNADDDREEFLSETDVDITHEKKWQCEEGQHTRTWENRAPGFLVILKTYRWLIDTLLLVTIIALLLLLLRKPTQHNTKQVGADFTPTSREFSTMPIKWNADYSFVPPNTSEFLSDALITKWNTMLPASASRGTPGQTFGATSMTHQLHCLFMMGRIYSALQANTTDILPNGYDVHYLHCIDYLRQAVMCAGDVSLEPHTPEDGDDLGPQDGGWNGIHVCKNYDEVIDYLEGQIIDRTRVILPIDD